MERPRRRALRASRPRLGHGPRACGASNGSVMLDRAAWLVFCDGVQCAALWVLSGSSFCAHHGWIQVGRCVRPEGARPSNGHGLWARGAPWRSWCCESCCDTCGFCFDGWCACVCCAHDLFSLVGSNLCTVDPSWFCGGVACGRWLRGAFSLLAVAGRRRTPDLCGLFGAGPCGGTQCRSVWCPGLAAFWNWKARNSWNSSCECSRGLCCGGE